MPYTREKPRLPETPEQLRARIPGWGVDKDPADRPSVPRLRLDSPTRGARWDLPERQLEQRPRERSVEHAFLTPVFGTAQPLKGLSGVIRRYAYERYSEGRAAHWLVLMAGDRVDVIESNLASILRGRPGNRVDEHGLRSELTHHGLSSRSGRRRSDVKHQWMDPLVAGAPWIISSIAVATVVRRLRRR
ncbi:MAG: hypothetical protein ACJ72P_06715 [Nocardioides sp.]